MEGGITGNKHGGGCFMGADCARLLDLEVGHAEVCSRRGNSAGRLLMRALPCVHHASIESRQPSVIQRDMAGQRQTVRAVGT